MPIKMLRLYLVAILLGSLTGLVGSFFQLAILILNKTLAYGLAYGAAHHWPVVVISAIASMVLVFTAWLLVQYIAPEAGGSGVQEIEGALLHKRPIHWQRLLPVKFIGGILSISANMVLGREGPTIQMGGNLGEMLGLGFGIKPRRKDAFIAAGAAAGLATAFNAPLAGVLFVLEEMRQGFRFSFINFQIVTIACVCATIVLHMMVGAKPAISMSIFALPSLHSSWLFFIFGLSVGLAAFLFNRTLMASLALMDDLPRWGYKGYVLFIGLIIGAVAYIYPALTGGGYEIIEKALSLRPDVATLMWLLSMRFMATILCYNTGVPGGIFAPMLALGTLLGLAASYGLQWLMPDVTVHPGMFAVAGMGAFFAATVRAPLTGIVLVVEMTQNYSLILPLMISCLTATSIIEFLNNPPIYTQLLRRTLKKQRMLLFLKQR